MINQIGLGMISVSWTPPPAPPSNGYRDSEDFSAGAGIDTMSTSQNLSVSPGVHTIRVHIHLPGRIAAMDITVLGESSSLC